MKISNLDLDLSIKEKAFLHWSNILKKRLEEI